MPMKVNCDSAYSLRIQGAASSASASAAYQNFWPPCLNSAMSCS